jgi:hypothetical protein
MRLKFLEPLDVSLSARVTRFGLVLEPPTEGERGGVPRVVNEAGFCEGIGTGLLNRLV